MSNLSFTEDAFEDYLYWQQEDKKTLRRINQLLKAIQRDPFSGEGKPEPLRGNLSRLWSRRINDKDRLVYSQTGDTFIIYQCKGHYNDK